MTTTKTTTVGATLFITDNQWGAALRAEQKPRAAGNRR